MFRNKTYLGMLGEWKRMFDVLGENADELSYLEVSKERLGARLAQAEAMLQQQGESKVEKQDASRQLRSVMAEGQRLATVLRLAVKEYYGIDSEKLSEFGLQPFRGRRPTKKAPHPGPEITKHVMALGPVPPSSEPVIDLKAERVEES